MYTDAYQSVMADIHAGGILVMDGAIGTELQRRGAPMAAESWCALATENSPDILRSIHRDYITAGARIVTANTFASTQQVLSAAGELGKFSALNKRSVEIAVEAREQSNAIHPVLVAGSISPHMPGQYNNPRADSDAARFEEECIEMAAIHKAAGADFILAEMMGDPVLSPCVTRAAQANAIPVWVGFAFRPNSTGALGICSNDYTSYNDALAPVIEAGGDVMGIMHTRAQYVSEVLSGIRRHWSGPTMVYPDDIPFRKSVSEEIRLDDIINEREFVEYCKGWRREGVSILGGCCGLTVSHIRMLAEYIAE